MLNSVLIVAAAFLAADGLLHLSVKGWKAFAEYREEREEARLEPLRSLRMKVGSLEGLVNGHLEGHKLQQESVRSLSQRLAAVEQDIAALKGIAGPRNAEDCSEATQSSSSLEKGLESLLTYSHQTALDHGKERNAHDDG